MNVHLSPSFLSDKQFDRFFFLIAFVQQIQWLSHAYFILQPKGDTTIEENHDDSMWINLNFTVDSETGELNFFFVCKTLNG